MSICITFLFKLPHKIRRLSYQSIEHNNVDTSKQATLPSNDTLMVQPISEEEIDVESSALVRNHIFEANPSNQQQDTHVEGLNDDQSKGVDNQTIAAGLNLRVHADQRIVATGELNASLGKVSRRHDNSSKTATPTTIGQTTSMTINPEELDGLEKINPIEAFDLIIRSGTLSSKTIEGSSNTSNNDSSETSKENLLVELRTKVLEVDLFQAIEQDASIISGIKELLHKLSKASLGLKFQEFFQNLEILTDEIDQSFKQWRIEQFNLEDQTKLHDQLVAEFTTFKQKLVVFRQEIPDAK